MKSFCWFVLGFVMATLISAATFFAYKAYCPDAHSHCPCAAKQSCCDELRLPKGAKIRPLTSAEKDLLHLEK